MSVRLITHHVEPRPVGPRARPRDSVGGRAFLPAGRPWPLCDCGRPMALFFQLGIRPAFGLPFVAESHLTVFVCPWHDDTVEGVPHPVPADYGRVARGGCDGLRFYQLALDRPPGRRRHDPSGFVAPPEPYLVPHALRFRRRVEENLDRDSPEPIYQGEFRAAAGTPGVNPDRLDPRRGTRAFKVGGQPAWAQFPEGPACACGSAMPFLCQVPGGYEFPRGPVTDPAADWLYPVNFLFLESTVYLFACAAQCSPFAVVATTQH